MNESYLAESLWRIWVKESHQDPFEALMSDMREYRKPGNSMPEAFPGDDQLINDALKKN